LQVVVLLFLLHSVLIWVFIAADMKREQKKGADKVAGQLEAKLRALDDVRKTSEAQIQALQKTNSDIAAK
jgi:hypothetical protein